MKIELKWIEGIRRKPVPAIYACTIQTQGSPYYFYSVILTFPQQVRTYANLDLLMVKGLDIGDNFYITEGGHVVAEAQKYVTN